MDLCGNQDKGRKKKGERSEGERASPQEHTGADMNKGSTVAGMVGSSLFASLLFCFDFDVNLVCKKLT